MPAFLLDQMIDFDVATIFDPEALTSFAQVKWAWQRPLIRTYPCYEVLKVILPFLSLHSVRDFTNTLVIVSEKRSRWIRTK